MGKTKPPPYPRPQDLDAKVYAAIMGHAPQVGPPEKLGPDAWRKWPVLRDLNGPRWQHLRRICNDAVHSPRVRERMAPLVAQARKRWTEARERLGKGHCGAALPGCERSPEGLHHKTHPESERPVR